jgi:hypothetical protein
MEDGMYEAARAIRPYLTELIGDRAPRFDDEVAALLAAVAQGDDVTDPLRLLLRSDEATEEWLDEVLADPLRRPPDHQPVVTRNYDSLIGLGAPVDAGKYACPHGDYVWYRPYVGVAIPPCATHGLTLQPVPL